MKFTAQGLNPQALADRLRQLPRKDVPYVTARALTKTAQIAQRQDILDEMRRVYDRPTRYTLNSLYIVPATKKKLEAQVAVKNRVKGGGNLPEHFLVPTVESGGRRLKRFERALQHVGALPDGWQAMPGRGARKNRYGNISARYLKAVIDELKTGKSRRYFAVQPGHRSMPAGVYERRQGGLKIILYHTRRLSSYSVHLNFEQVAQKTAEREFERAFRIGMKQALEQYER